MLGKRFKATLVALLCGATTLATAVSCDPLGGTFDFFRDNGHGGFSDSFFDVGVFVDDGYYDNGYFDDGFYEDDFFYEDCFFGCF